MSATISGPVEGWQIGGQPAFLHAGKGDGCKTNGVAVAIFSKCVVLDSASLEVQGVLQKVPESSRAKSEIGITSWHMAARRRIHV